MYRTVKSYIARLERSSCQEMYFPPKQKSYHKHTYTGITIFPETPGACFSWSLQANRLIIRFLCNQANRLIIRFLCNRQIC